MTNPAGRATRDAGKATRRALLQAATEVFSESGEQASVASICQRAGAFPNQVTYYFGSKEQLFVEVACAAVLRAGRSAETAASQTSTVRDYAGTLVRTLVGEQARNVELFTTAMLLVSRRTDLRPLVAETLETLYHRGEQALLDTLVRTGWQLRTEVAVEARAFWSAIFGLIVQQAALGADELTADAFDAVAVVFTNMQIPESVLDAPLTSTAENPVPEPLS